MNRIDTSDAFLFDPYGDAENMDVSEWPDSDPADACSWHYGIPIPSGRPAWLTFFVRLFALIAILAGLVLASVLIDN